ncbi:F1F0 ATP synthase subunit e, mitochondrial [Ascochyta rabiei]|uniref:ATP synthase F(0) complex subunit e, mitochondrial n=1 Tax=Didymella rabiei TaxID=5454 RepID=A0A163JAR4_DIDRA|nr:F1F0 ATP synthase subunit e, mitochondrial [Ascochyta rabiei]KZM26248.1 hydrogen ion transmembrane transporter [Ascochyta rabiei]UPX11593.1 F1F0 ATP synthase subunit e, mitochondrial [Ascochyta rabiei]
MSTSVGVNVLRWSALATGLFYGAYTQLSISAREKVQAEQKAYNHKESLIRQAKQEWAKTHPQEQPKPSSGAKADPKDPNADLNAILGITDEK